MASAIKHTQFSKTFARRQDTEQNRRTVFQQIGKPDMTRNYEIHAGWFIFLQVNEFLRPEVADMAMPKQLYENFPLKAREL